MKTIVQLKLENFLNDRGLLEQFKRDCKEIGYTIESLCGRQVNLFNRDSASLYFMFRAISSRMDSKYGGSLGREFLTLYDKLSEYEVIIDHQWDNMWED